jgi:hypothetical protein
MRLEEIHPSHVADEYYDLPDPHNPGYQCRVCKLATCSMCPSGHGADDGDLAAECPGVPWWQRETGRAQQPGQGPDSGELARVRRPAAPAAVPSPRVSPESL